ncbi:MAG: polysaccharide biosynthesis tyrosine autokinase [Anaerolineae bacterium]
MELRQYAKIIWRWWWLIALSTGIAAVTSYVASLQQPRIYKATTTLIVGQVIQKANPTGQDFYTTERLAQSYAQVARRQPILQAAIESLGLQMSWQSLKERSNIQPLQGTQLLEISVLDNSPERAKAIADEVAHQLILQSPTSPENQARQERGTFVQAQLDDLEARIAAAQARIKDLEAELATAFSARQIQDLQTEISNLQTLITGWQANYAELLSFLEGGDSPNYLAVIEPAQLPAVPVSPKVRLNVLLAAALGLALALGGVFLLEYLDDTIKSPDDLSESLGLTTLGAVSRIEGKDYQDKLITAGSPFSPVAEAYRMLRGNIQFMTVDQPARSILVTSPTPTDGKSTTVANLGVVMAQADLKTIIVDTDLRRPVMHKIFGVPNLGGLTDLLRSPGLEVNSQLKNTGIENLRVLTSGPLPPNPSEMLGSQRMAQLVERLEAVADVIIFDSPPTLAVSDAAALSNRVDGVILVTQAGRTRRDMTRRALKSLQQVGANILGGVLNRVPSRRGGYYYYQYHHYYARNGDGPETAPGRAWAHRWWRRISARRPTRRKQRPEQAGRIR